MDFGDTTKVANPGDYVRAKYTVWLDKKPGGSVDYESAPALRLHFATRRLPDQTK